MKVIDIEQVDFETYWDAQRVYFHATYRGILKAKLSIRRPYDLHEGFLESEQPKYFHKKLLALIQRDLNILTA